MPDEPLASRRLGPHGADEIEAAVAAVEARLTAKPDDGKGGRSSPRSTCGSHRYSDAAHAYAEGAASAR
jgi:hypothetical protein